MKKFLLVVLAVLILLRVLMAVCDLHFTSAYTGHLFWFVFSISGLMLWWSHSKERGRNLLILFSLLFYTCWFIIVYSIVNHSSMPEKFRNLDREVWQKAHHTLGATNGKYTIAIGKSYLGGLLFKEDFRFEYDFYDSYIDSENYVIPVYLVNLEGYVFWKERGWLFDFDNKICYKLKQNTRNRRTAADRTGI